MISVALAAYKGERYIYEQIRSILPQLGKDDEIIVSDDKPGGATEKLVRKMMEKDKRIKYYKGKGRGVVENFVNAIRYCRGDKIFLCDQDDVWLPDKVKLVMREFDKGADLVLHNAYVTDRRLRITDYSFFELRKSRKGIVNNIVKNSYMGCCMAFDRRMLKKIMPMPRGVPMHDQWIGLICEVYGKVVFLDQPLIYHRMHGGNVTGTKKNSFYRKAEWRRYITTRLIRRVVFNK